VAAASASNTSTIVTALPGYGELPFTLETG